MVLFFSVEEWGIGRIGRGVSERVKAFNRDRDPAPTVDGRGVSERVKAFNRDRDPAPTVGGRGDPAPTVFVKFVLKGWHSAAA